MRKLISPVTRINGFWTVEVDVEGGRVIDARSSGIFFRGMELILLGRDPRDAPYITERICGICSSAHGWAASLALEEAWGVTPPPNGVLVRNLIFGADLLQNHIRHLYHFALPDYVKGPDRPPFIPRYKIDYRLPAEENDRIFAHYLEAFDISRLCHEMVVLLGGKVPHAPGLVAGGATVPPSPDRIRTFGSMLTEVTRFVENRLLPDIARISQVYPEYFEIGGRPANLLTYGEFNRPDRPAETEMPPGVVISGRIEALDDTVIEEHVHFSWYDEGDGPVHPTGGRTTPRREKGEAYSWVKAPRYRGHVLETGPLATLWVSGDYRRGVSTMDRLLARAQHAWLFARKMKQWLADLEIGGPVFTPFEPGDGEGKGLFGAMRGALGHWLRIERGRISHYQIVTPSAWNCSPHDDRGRPGAVEESLVGTPVADIDNPVEVSRVLRAYDPCLACAVQVGGPERPRTTILIS